jgi:hypothetical protein
MAGIKITSLPENNKVNPTDSYLKVYNGVTYQVNGQTFLNNFNAVSSALNIAQSPGASISQFLAGISNDGKTLYFSPLSGTKGIFTYNNTQTSAVIVGIAPQSIQNSMLSAYAVGTPNIIDGSITSSKMNPIDNFYAAKAWANFSNYIGGAAGPASTSLLLTAGSSVGRWLWNANWPADVVGVKYYFNAITGVSVPQQTSLFIQGVNVGLSGIRITSIDSTNPKIANFVFLGGTLTSSPFSPLSAQKIQINGNGANSGYAYYSYGIRDSHNIKKITLMGTGDYYLEFQTPATTPYYCAVANAGGKRRTYSPYNADAPTTWAATSNAGLNGFYVYTNATACPVNHVVVYGR